MWSACSTVQMDHIDWGFRVSTMYGENYRYTTAYGIFSDQTFSGNHFAGYDMPMVYGEMYIPYVAQGFKFRLGRYIRADIEAQLAPKQLYVLALDDLRARQLHERRSHSHYSS